jgi:hypothetical protein
MFLYLLLVVVTAYYDLPTTNLGVSGVSILDL